MYWAFSSRSRSSLRSRRGLCGSGDGPRPSFWRWFARAGLTATATTPPDAETTAVTGQGGGTGVQVIMTNRSYDPQTVTIRVGDTVTWVNEDAPQHDVVADNGEFAESAVRRGPDLQLHFHQGRHLPVPLQHPPGDGRDCDSRVGACASVEPGDDAPRHALPVVGPQVAILGCAATLVGPLSGEEQGHVVERVEPDHPRARVAQQQRQPHRLDDLAQVVHMTGDAPEPAAQQGVVSVAEGLGLA